MPLSMWKKTSNIKSNCDKEFPFFSFRAVNYSTPAEQIDVNIFWQMKVWQFFLGVFSDDYSFRLRHAIILDIPCTLKVAHSQYILAVFHLCALIFHRSHSTVFTDFPGARSSKDEFTSGGRCGSQRGFA